MDRAILFRFHREPAVCRERPFDVLHLVEWDLLPCAPLAELYDHVPVDGLALSGLRPMAEARRDGWSWITDEGEYKHADDYRRLREYVGRELGFDDEGPSCLSQQGVDITTSLSED